MKRCMCLILSTLLVLSLNIPLAVAVEPEYSNNVLEEVTENGIIHKVLYRHATEVATTTTDMYAQIKKELIAIGMDVEAVENLTTDQLNTFNSSKALYSTTEYTRTTEDGAVTIIPEETAILEAKQSQATRAGGTADKSDAYRRVTHVAADLGGGDFAFSTNAWWLTNPSYTGVDSIGSCAMLCARDPNTESGYLRYTRTRKDSAGNVISTNTLSPSFSQSQFQTDIKGTFYGVGATFDLPDNIPGEEYYSDFYVFFYYRGAVTTPDDAANFNTIGTYTHSSIGVSASPTLSITLSPKPGVSAGMGISAYIKKDSTSAEALVRYIP